jgi:aryl-alcohol dehydrogenase-like predicted oxidoreductase
MSRKKIRIYKSTYFGLFSGRNEGLGILPWSPLAGGWLSGKYDRSMEKPQEGSRYIFRY